ncbi:hypothetical protein [Nocardioides sp. S5]|uniref:hypothetical protein n=1 Tax=Nocardioides sp. S5 TaxID=2017486 RepID=UPI001A8D568E|nr:hypothetical protein [Nocardioides sp. S5]
MDEHDDTPEPQQQSVTERQLRRLVVPAPAACDPSKRIDVMHELDLDLLRGGLA